MELTQKCNNVICGVPHGSILGTKLFILYINDLCNSSTLLEFVLFADDTNLFQVVMIFNRHVKLYGTEQS